MKIFTIAFGSFVSLMIAYAVFAQFHHWSQSYSTNEKDLRSNTLWEVWTDVNNWNKWQSDIEYAKLDSDFIAGNTFVLKPKGVPEMTIDLISVQTNKLFIDVTSFPLAKMYTKHEIIKHGDEIEVKTTVSVDGFLGFVWRKIVAEDVANSLPKQTESLIKFVRGI